MNVEEMKRQKQDLGYSCEKISELSGVPLGTVQKIFSGFTKTPRYETLQLLDKVFQNKDIHHIEEIPAASMVKESVFNYGAVKKQGEYNLKDYYSIPEERRVELIDGEIYDMGAPTNIHQQLILEICMRLKAYVRKEKGGCVVSMAPTDVQLDCDDRTMVQPDLLVVCDREKVLYSHMYGAPDLAVEILSPATRKKDMGLKLWKYSNAGVREYWVVDSEKKKVLVYDLEHEELLPMIYGFDNVVPVGIFHGECRVDFAEIYEDLSFLYEREERQI